MNEDPNIQLFAAILVSNSILSCLLVSELVWLMLMLNSGNGVTVGIRFCKNGASLGSLFIVSECIPIPFENATE
jgi:hypothetical protein